MAATRMRPQLPAVDVPIAPTLADWAAQNGYNPKTRKYTKPKATARAIPGAHPGTSTSTRHQKVA